MQQITQIGSKWKYLVRCYPRSMIWLGASMCSLATVIGMIFVLVLAQSVLQIGLQWLRFFL